MRKNVVKYFKMFDATNIASNQTSQVTNVINMDKASIQVEWTGSSPVGNIVVEARNGEISAWYALDFGTAISVSGASGTHQIVLNEMPFTDLRLRYVSTSGTGSLSATITLKQVGG